MRTYGIASVACVLLSGCAGGGSPSHDGAPAVRSHTVTLSLVVPPRSLAYVSSTTQSMSVQVNGGTATVTALTPLSPACTTVANGTACTVSVAAPAGTPTIVVTLYASTNGTGSPLSSATLTPTIAADVANVTVPLVLAGYVASIVQTPALPALAAQTGGTVTFSLTAYDAGGAAIVGSTAFANGPIAISGSGLSFSPATITSPAATTVTATIVSPNVTTVPLTFAWTAGSGGGSLQETTPPNLTATVSTYAGDVSGSNGSANGMGTAARFYGPTGVAVDGSGNVYVADAYNNVIRVITTAQVTTTIGTGTAGFANGIGSSAAFSGPSGVAVDSSGTLYVADTGNHCIRSISSPLSAATVATVAGTCGPASGGFADGIGGLFSGPQGIAVDASGALYVADTLNSSIRKIVSGTVSTIAGAGIGGYSDGPAAGARFTSPAGVAVDGSGNVYIADGGNNRIRQLSGTTVSTLAGSGTAGGTDAAAASATFNSPSGVAVDSSGRVFVAGNSDHKIRVVAFGSVYTLAGTGSSGTADGAGLSAQFNRPQAIAINAAGTVLYVANHNNNNIRKLTIP